MSVFLGKRKELKIPTFISNKYKNITLWSYSKISTFKNCNYEYFLNRIKQYKSEDNIYSIMGGYSHEILENFYEGKISYKDMVKKFEEAFLDVEISDFKFSNDETMNENIRNKYKNSIIHFFRNHNTVKHKVLIEKEVWIDIEGNIFVGYVDAIHKEEDTFIITDYKTSSINEYKGKKLFEKQNQLLIYALGVNQLGVPLEKIRIRWNFLKYTNIIIKHKVYVTYIKNGKETRSCLNKQCWVEELKFNIKKDILNEFPGKDRKEVLSILQKCIDDNSLKSLPYVIQNKYRVEQVIKVEERLKWVSAIQHHLKKDLKDLYNMNNLEADILISNCIVNNSLDEVPEDIRRNYVLDDCYIYGVVSKENIDNLCADMIQTINIIKDKGDLEDNWCSSVDNDYYCNVLCGVRKHCKYYKAYLDSLNKNHMENINILDELESIR